MSLVYVNLYQMWPERVSSMKAIYKPQQKTRVSGYRTRNQTKVKNGLKKANQT